MLRGIKKSAPETAQEIFFKTGAQRQVAVSHAYGFVSNGFYPAQRHIREENNSCRVCGSSRKLREPG